MKHFTVTATTMGQANPTHIGEGRNYRWRYREFCNLRGEDTETGAAP